MPEWIRAIDRVVSAVLRDAAINRPPVDAEAIAERLQLPVFEQERLPVRAKLVGSEHSETIVVRTEDRFERTQYSVAHELGEHFLQRVCRRKGEAPEFVSADLAEQICHRFAERLLCPKPWFEREADRCDFDLPALKSRFETASHEVIALRMLQCDVWSVITVFDNGRVTRRESNVGGTPPDLQPTERDAWRRCTATGDAQTTETELFRVQVWPVWEYGWKREIIRTSARDW